MGKARERVEEALKKVNEGADFVRIAKDYSTGPSTAKGEPIAVDPKEVNPALAEAIGNLKPGEHSGVVEVRHGYTIVKLLDRTPAGYKPLEVVRGEIRAELETKAKRSHAAKYFMDYDNKLAPKKHYEKFDGGDDKTILFELADVEFTKGDFLKTISDSEDKETLTSSQEMREGKLNRILQQKMRIHAARSRGIDQDATFISRMKGIENDVLYARMLSRLANERKNESEITEEDLKEAYESLKDRLLSDKEVRIQALQFKIEMDRPGFRPPSKKAQADVYWKARSVAKRVQAGEDFTEVIKECDPDQGDGIMGVQPLGRYAPRFREAIDKLAVGEVSDPILTDDGFIFCVIKLLEVKEPRKLAFEESKDLLKPNVSRQKMQKTQQNVLDELAAKYNLTVDEGNVAGLLSP
jgi:parvulin-like peptidyl-prolyl isomerase